MFDREQLERNLIEQCLEPDSLLLLLRGNQFDEAKYQKLKNTLLNYQKALNSETVINRRTAAFLRTIEIVFEEAVIYSDRQVEKSEVGRKIRHAHAEILELMDDIFDVNLGQ